jgi:uncharacterized protein (DUF1697 family)
MPRLRETLTARGYGEVRTHLRSGNVVLDSNLGEPRLARELTAAIAEDFGMDVPVVLRSGQELADIVARDPLGDLVTDPSRSSVTFLPEPPAPDLVAALPAADSGEYRVSGRELFLWLPDGMARSPMATWKWGRLLGVEGTNRNWNTVTKLAELAA